MGARTVGGRKTEKEKSEAKEGENTQREESRFVTRRRLHKQKHSPKTEETKMK
jgi:hypothetical protein